MSGDSGLLRGVGPPSVQDPEIPQLTEGEGRAEKANPRIVTSLDSVGDLGILSAQETRAVTLARWWQSPEPELGAEGSGVHGAGEHRHLPVPGWQLPLSARVSEPQRPSERGPQASFACHPTRLQVGSQRLREAEGLTQWPQIQGPCPGSHGPLTLDQAPGCCFPELHRAVSRAMSGAFSRCPGPRRWEEG